MNLTDAHRSGRQGKKKFPVGRGHSSGCGKTSGRGRKGQYARESTSFRPYFEGGQMSIIRRIPKRGFNNAEFRTEYEAVNLSDVSAAFKDGETVDRASLKKAGLVRRDLPIKLLGGGTIDKKLVIKVDRASGSAIEKCAKAGATLEQSNPAPAPKPPAKEASKDAGKGSKPAPPEKKS